MGGLLTGANLSTEGRKFLLYLLNVLSWRQLQDRYWVLRFNSMGVEIHELRPEVVAESEGVLVHYRSRTNV